MSTSSQKISHDLMKAISFSQYGKPEVLSIIEINKPIVDADEVLIKVKYAGLNPMCCKLRSGKFKDSWGVSFPAVLGFEVSGIIVDKGINVKDFSIDDLVLSFFSNDLNNSGGFAEYVAIKATFVKHIPQNITMAQASGLGLVGVTAWQALVETANIKNSDHVLIHSAAGGVGQIAIQLAKLYGKFVVGTSSPENHILLKRLGCDFVLDYKEDFFRKIQDKFPCGFDVILETIGGEHQRKSYQLLKNEGRLVSIVGEEIDLSEMKQNTHGFRITANPGGNGLSSICSLIDTNVIKAHTVNIFDKKDIVKAHYFVESGKSCGKTIIKISEE